MINWFLYAWVEKGEDKLTKEENRNLKIKERQGFLSKMFCTLYVGRHM